MSQYSDFETPDIERHEDPRSDTNHSTEPAEELRTAESRQPAAEDPEDATWHAEAGRKGAQRIHQLIEEGRLYEKEHGLKRGRQRLRQLIELGEGYEHEHRMRRSLEDQAA